MSKSSIITKGVATPNRVTTHPGEMLSEEFLKPLEMSVNALAIALRVRATRIGAIVIADEQENALCQDLGDPIFGAANRCVSFLERQESRNVSLQLNAATQLQNQRGASGRDH